MRALVRSRDYYIRPQDTTRLQRVELLSHRQLVGKMIGQIELTRTLPVQLSDELDGRLELFDIREAKLVAKPCAG